MRQKRHTPKEIVSKLRQVDVLVAQGTPVADAIRAIGVTEVTYYRWRQEYGGLKSDQIKRMKELETENARLRKAIPIHPRQADPAGGCPGKLGDCALPSCTGMDHDHVAARRSWAPLSPRAEIQMEQRINTRSEAVGSAASGYRGRLRDELLDGETFYKRRRPKL